MKIHRTDCLNLDIFSLLTVAAAFMVAANAAACAIHLGRHQV